MGSSWHKTAGKAIPVSTFLDIEVDQSDLVDVEPDGSQGSPSCGLQLLLRTDRISPGRHDWGGNAWSRVQQGQSELWGTFEI